MAEMVLRCERGFLDSEGIPFEMRSGEYWTLNMPEGLTEGQLQAEADRKEATYFSSDVTGATLYKRA